MKLKHTFTKPKKKKKKIKLKKNKKVEFTKLLQLIHLRFGGSFMRPLIIFSFLSSSFLLPISKTLKSASGEFYEVKTTSWVGGGVEFDLNWLAFTEAEERNQSNMHFSLQFTFFF